MRVMVFPAAFMANTFAMMMVMIGLSLFGKPELAADFGLVHAATVALFYSFSGNARSLILGVEAGGAESASILRLRFFLVLPLAALAWALCAGVVEGGVFILLLVLRRAAEWLAEIFLSEQEVQRHETRAVQFFVLQGISSLLVLVALVNGGWLAWPMTLLWAVSPLLGCFDSKLLRRALGENIPVLDSLRVLLPHFGSTAVIGVSVYVFRLFLLLLVGKEVAGDLFSAFALGGILGAVFSQALGPSMVRQEQQAAGSKQSFGLFNIMLVGLLLMGALLGSFVWMLPGLMSWTLKSDFFWMAVAFSLMGGVVMVQAQRIRLRIIQGAGRGDVFGSDILANVLLVASVPFLYFGLGVSSLSVLYLLSGVFALFFYASERSGLFRLGESGRLLKFLLMSIAFLVMLPVFFQLSGGLFVDKDVYFNSAGQLSLLPIPISVMACYCGVVMLGRYGDARLALMTILFLFFGMFFVSFIKGVDGNLILLVQFILPLFALVLGQQYGARPLALLYLAVAGAAMLSFLVPMQLLAAWLAGTGYLLPHIFFFSIYQHLQYVPVVFVGIFLTSLFVLSERNGFLVWLIFLTCVVAAYAVVSLSMLAQGFLVLGLLGFVVRYLLAKRVVMPSVIVISVLFGGFLGYDQVSDSPLLIHKYAAFDEDEDGSDENEDGSSAGRRSAREFAVRLLPVNLHERQEMWRFYSEEVASDWGSFLIGHSGIPDRERYPSAHNYYLDFLYHFGVIGIFPLIALVVYTLYLGVSRFQLIWNRSGLLGLLGVVVFFLIADNSLKVGMRQPYPGILMFFFWGVLLTLLKAIPASASDNKG